jgi:hypothetical protein
MFVDPIEILEDRYVHTFFLGILDSQLTSEEKYQKFVEFFQKRKEINEQLISRIEQAGKADPDRVNQIISQVGQELGYWDPDKTRDQIADSIRRGVRRLRASQHADGGWGPWWEYSEVWGTANAVLCFDAARAMVDFDLGVDTEMLISNGLAWLEANRSKWTVENLGDQGEKPVYDASLVLRCLTQTQNNYEPGTYRALEALLDKVAGSQNEDGGWDAKLWGAQRWPIHKWSEVGATSAALRALAANWKTEFQPLILKGLGWLVNTQNVNGSWNNGSCRSGELPDYQVDGLPVINKTCDAIKGLLVSLSADVPYERFKPNVEKAVEWLRRQEKPILDSNHRITGWSWENDQFSAFEYENASMTLETLVRVPNASTSILAANAEWLVNTQHKQEGDPEDGNWNKGDTARITRALIEYFHQIKASLLSNHPGSDDQ